MQDVLRLPDSCKLRTSAGDLLPVTTQADNKCNSQDPTQGCNQFVAGDVRNNEHSALAAVHVAFLREHNRLCDMLKNSARTEDAKFEIVRAVRAQAALSCCSLLCIPDP